MGELWRSHNSVVAGTDEEGKLDWGCGQARLMSVALGGGEGNPWDDVERKKERSSE